jgi:hypothetical protein
VHSLTGHFNVLNADLCRCFEHMPPPKPLVA